MNLSKSSILLVIIVFFTACQKEYTCTCKDDKTDEVTSVSVLELSKDNAESACNNADAEEGVSCILDQK